MAAGFSTVWHGEPEHGVVVTEDDRCATQHGIAPTYVWAAQPLPATGRLYWEVEFEQPEPDVPAATWITREDLQRFVDDTASSNTARPAGPAACCASRPQAPPARSTRQLLRRLGAEWTLKTLTKRLDELAQTDPDDIEWPPPPERPTRSRGDSLGGTYFVGVVEHPVGGETVLRSKDGAWGISDDKTNGESHLRANGKPAGAVPDESLNASAAAFGHGERVGVMADMDSRPRVLQFYRDGVLLPNATVSGVPEVVYIAATPKRKGVKARLSFPGAPKPRQPADKPSAAVAKPAAAGHTRKGSKALWKVAATAVEPQLAAAAAADRKQTVWKVAQQAVRKRRADFKQNKTPCTIEYVEPGPLGIAFGYDGGTTWVEAVSRSGMTANLTSSMERDIEGYVVSEVGGARVKGFDEVADRVQSGERPITFVFTYPTKEEVKVMKTVEKEWIKEDKRGEKAKLQEAKAAARASGKEMREEAAAYKLEVKQASKMNKETGKLATRGSANDRKLSKATAKSGWKTLKRSLPEELKKKKKPSLFEMAAQEQANVQKLVAKSNPTPAQARPTPQIEPPAASSAGGGGAVGAAAVAASSGGQSGSGAAALVNGRSSYGGGGGGGRSTEKAAQGPLRDSLSAGGSGAAAAEAAAEAQERRAQRHAAQVADDDDGGPRRSSSSRSGGGTQATRAKARGALLAGLRNGKLAAAVETIEQADAAIAQVADDDDGRPRRSSSSRSPATGGGTQATRAKTRGALLAGLRNGKLAAAVETIEQADAAIAPQTGGSTPAGTGRSPTAPGRKASTSTNVPKEAEVAELQQQLQAAKLESAELGRSVLWLREILTAKEQQANPAAESSAGDAPGIIQDQLFRATDELCETRIEAAEMHARNDELERQMLEITTAYKARLAESEGEREHALAVAKKERRALTKELRLAKEEKTALERRLLVAAGGSDAGGLPSPASPEARADATTAAAATAPRQGDF